MNGINPDLEWYSEKSSVKNVAVRCSYANVHKCYKYYASLYLLGGLNVASRIQSEKVAELDEYWAESGLIPVLEEFETTVTYDERNSLASVRNFCPEVSYDFYGLFADYMHKYVDDIDKSVVQKRLARESLTSNWHWSWMSVSPKHYTECKEYFQLPYLKAEPSGTEQVIEIKPSFLGVSVDLRAVYKIFSKSKANKFSRWFKRYLAYFSLKCRNKKDTQLEKYKK